MTTATDSKAVRAAREIAISRGCSPEDAERHILSGAEDPGQWSPGARVIIHTEWVCELGDYWSSPDTCEISECMNMRGVPGFFEWVNSAVLAFYE